MSVEWSTLVEGGIPILGGLYATALGFGVVASQPGPVTQKYVNHCRWLGPSVVLSGVFMAWQAHLHTIHPPVEEIARGIAGRLTLPSRVDEITQLVAVKGQGDDLIYEFAISAPLKDVGGRKEAQHRLEQQLLSSACDKKDFQTLLRAGYTLQMRYSFKDPEQIVISIPPRSCGY